ncbi:LOW QUALITY PROTEIN: inhibitor of growth protein 3-like [Anopheles ziemanni]|uniref:LOW QUALITY PROTEIN: inhibitor of growth protein 3-like n=1 Tax=Anopheles ziemanni TaxID=345580 RepID=UPI002660062B|nr:LOW QUALITY PROTEIN: inhibitor of growth protein 3-like [Anopheles ziemanni]
MQHLEDCLEMIEHLPQELRDGFTEMREMDLTVQNNTDSLDKRARSLFQQCYERKLPTAVADAEFNAIRGGYNRVLDDSDEKIQLAGQMYDVVERYMRRLDTELYKFKCELEADHNGITEILEQRSLEVDSNALSNGGTNQKENPFYDVHHSYSGTSSGRSDSRYKSEPVKRRESVAVTAAEKRAAAASGASASNVAPIMNVHIRPTTPGTAVPASIVSGTIVVPPAMNVGAHASSSKFKISYNLPNFSPAGFAIAAAASQAIAQTQQMQQGCQTGSLKASYEVIGAKGSQELLVNSELAGATHNGMQGVERESSVFSNQRRTKKKDLTSTPNTANSAAGGVQGTTTTTLLSSNSIVTPILTTLSNQTPFAILGQQTTTLQQQQQQQQQVGTVQVTQSLVQPQQQQKGSTLEPYIMGTNGPIAVQQQINLHHSNTQVPLQHLQPVSQQPMLQQLAVRQQQPAAMKQELLPQQIQQLDNIENVQQKHILLPTAPQQAQQRLTHPQQLQELFQQSLQSLQSLTPQLLQQQQPQQPVPATSQQSGQQQQLPMQTLAHPQLMQAQDGSHSLPLAPVPVQPTLKTRSGWKTITKPTLRRYIPGQTPHNLQRQVIHVQSQQRTQFQQIQQQQQHHHLQMVQQQFLAGPAGSSASGVLANTASAMALLHSSTATAVSTSSVSSLDGNRGEDTKGDSISGAGSTTLTASSGSSTSGSVVLKESGMVVQQTPEGEWSYDPNEPRYCICNQVSYGDMVACDNEDCPFEWFHYPCVNITSSPKGKWYCPQCSSSMKRRAIRKN